MSSSYARAGQRIAGRFDLARPYEYQPSFGNATAWIARDIALARQVRAVVIDPDADQGGAVADAARRAALVSDPHLVAIVQVVADADHAYITEIPPGRPLADYLTGEPLPADQVHAIIGEVTSVIATGARRGVRHLYPKAEAIFLTPEGDVVVDGLGVYAALVGADTSKDASEIDRDEARGLTVLLASLLLGRDLPDPSEHDAAIADAANLDLPQHVATTLANERDGDGAASPSDLTRRLVPWGDIHLDALPDPSDPEPLEFSDTVTVDDAAPTSDDTLIFYDDDSGRPSLPAQWPALAGPAGAAAAVAVSDGPDPDATQEFADLGVDGEADSAADEEAEAASEETGSTGEEAESAGEQTEPASEPTSEQPRASTPDEVKALIDEELGLDSNVETGVAAAWPGLSTVPTPEPLPSEPEPEAAAPESEFAGTTQPSDATDETVAITPIELSDEAADGTVPPEDLNQTEHLDETVHLDETELDETVLDETERREHPERLSLAQRFDDDSPSVAAAPAAATASAAATPQRKIRTPKLDPNKAAASEQARRERASARAAALDSYEEERGRTFDASRVVLALFAIAVIALGWIGLRALTAPFDPVTLTNPDSDITTAAPEDPAASEPGEEPGGEPEPAPAAEPVIASATLVSPDAGMIAGIDPAQQDSPGTVPNAVDGNPATAWQSWTYVSSTMDPMSGIGLHIELAEPATVTEVVLDVAGTGGNIQIRDTVLDAPSSGKVVAEGPITGNPTTMTLEEPLTASSFVIWITELPQNASGGNQIILNEITLN